MRQVARLLSFVFIVGLVSAFSALSAMCAVIHVDGENGNDSNAGLDWGSGYAKSTIQAAISAASSGDEVWVRGKSGTFNGVYNERIALVEGVDVYGGFEGDETVRPTRPSRSPLMPEDYQYETVIDGTMLSGCLVTSPAGITTATVVDGFTLRNGYAMIGATFSCATSSPTISHNRIEYNTSIMGGSGVYASSGSPDVKWNVIQHNTGAAVMIGTYSAANIVGNVIRGNSGYAVSDSGSATVTNNFISGNAGHGVSCTGGGTHTVACNTIAGNSGASGDLTSFYALNSASASPTFSLNIVAFNQHGIKHSGTGSPSLDHNCVYGNAAFDYSGVSAGQSDFSADPKLVDVEHGDLHIGSDSPCRDLVDSTSYAWDIDGGSRPEGDYVDVGADEYGSSDPSWTPATVMVDAASGDDDNDGSSWESAKLTIQAGIKTAAAWGGDVLVKEGTYSERIKLPAHVDVYGGYYENQQEEVVRDWQTHVTTIDGNVSPGGAAVWANVGHLVSRLDGFTIAGGTTTGSGGGIICSMSSPRIVNNTITGNSAGTGGGGICCQASWAEITNNVIYSNSCTGVSVGRGGGGIRCDSSSATIANNIIVGNSSASYGGGVYLAGTGTPKVTNNTVVGNTCGTGAGIYISSCAAALSNNIVASNTGTNGYGVYRDGTTAVTLRNNDVYGNSPANYYNISAGTGDISSDPLFVGGGSYRLQLGSSCINAGWNSAPGLPGTDMDYWPRVIPEGGTVDIGAYEYDSVAPSAPVVTDDGTHTTSTTQLHATWTSEDDGSGIVDYQYAIGTAEYPATGYDSVAAWTSRGLNTSVTVTGLTLADAQSYYFAVKAKDEQGNWSEIGVSDGITVDVTAPTVTVEQSISQPDPANTSPVMFTVTFSEPVSGFESSDVTIGGTASATAAVVTDSGDHAMYSIAVSGMASEGTVIAAIGAGVAQDAAGNQSTASNTASVSFILVPLPTEVICVSGQVGSDTNDGSAWGIPMATVDAALAAAAASVVRKEIWVASATYNAGELDSFYISPGVKLYGGFAGDEVQRDQRNPRGHETLLAGDWVVVTSLYDDTGLSVIDGFTIEGGDGWGVYCSNSNITISGNKIRNTGGGIWYEYSSPVIAGNILTGDSVGISGTYSTAHIHDNVVTSCLWAIDDDSGSSSIIAGNTLVGNAWGISCWGSSTVSNNIVAFQTSTGIAAFDGATPALSHNCVYGSEIADYNGVTPDADSISPNLNTPMFVNKDGGDYHLVFDSPCVDAGDDSTVGDISDLDGKPRRVDVPGLRHETTDIVDMGAYEYFDSAPPDGFTPIATPNDWTTGNVTVTFVTTDDGSGVDRYEVAVDQGAFSGEGVVPVGSSGSYEYVMSDEGRHRVFVKAVDRAGNTRVESVWTYIDGAAPEEGVVYDDGDNTILSSQLYARWSFVDAESGIDGYEYAIGTSPTDPGDNYIVGWTSAGAATSVTRTGLSLQSNTTYYFYVKATDNLGNCSDSVASNGILCRSGTTPVAAASVVEAYGNDVDTWISLGGLDGVVVTAGNDEMSGCFYVQDESLTSNYGMRVKYTGTSTFTRGDKVTVEGDMSIGGNGEVCLDAGDGNDRVTWRSSGNTLPNCWQINGLQWLGGGNAVVNGFTKPGVNAPLYGGAYNKGRYVRIYGTVTGVFPSEECFYIDYGTGMNDGTNHGQGVRVSWDWQPESATPILLPQVGWSLYVWGISSSEVRSGDGGIIRVMRIRDQNDLYVYAGGTPGIYAPPAWAADVIPADSSPTGEFGPSSADSVDLATGAGENNPAPDIIAENPVGPDVEFSRSYRSTTAEAGYATPGLSTGWVHNYDVRILGATGSWGDLTLVYPNGAQETLDVDASGGSPVFAPTGAPYLVTGQAGGIAGRWDWVDITFSDETSWRFTAPNPVQPDIYLLTRISDLLGHYVTVNRISATDTRLSSITNDASNTLVSFTYSGNYLSTVSDVSVAGSPREVTFTFAPEAGTTVLKSVSQINSPLDVRWQYSYTQTNGHPYLTWVEVPDPAAASGLRGHSIDYSGSGKVSSLLDANGNRRSYLYGGTSTQVFVKDSAGKLVEFWTQKIGPKGQDAGVIDAKGNATSIDYYADSYRPWRIYNKNNQSTELTYDSFGNVRTTTTPRGIVTTHNYDPSHPFRLVDARVGSKPASTIQYDGTGLVWKTNTPKPGTVWDGTPGMEQRVTTAITYTTLGNVKTIAEPAPSFASTFPCVTTVFDYTEDPDYGISGVTELLCRPLRVTVYDGVPTYTSSDKITSCAHFRYDISGRLSEVIDSDIHADPALRHRTNFEYNWAGQIRKTWFAPTTTDASKRAHVVYNYRYIGGPLRSIDLYDENNVDELLPAFRHIEATAGNEGEINELSGNVLSGNYAYDALYRARQFTDGRAHAKEFGYSAVGNPEQLMYPSGKTVKLGFDADANLDSRTDGRCRRTDYILDPVDSRLTDISYPTGTSPHFDYDGCGRVSRVIDSTGVIDYTYDDNDAPLTVTTTYTGVAPKTITYSYYPDGSRERMAISGFSDYPTLSYRYYNTYDTTYDIYGERQVSILPTAGPQCYFNYDRNGRVWLRRIGSYPRTIYDYNARGFMTGLHNASGTEQLTHSWFTSMSYDPAGNLLGYNYDIGNAWRTETGSVKRLTGTVAYTYDDFDRLTGEERTDNDPVYSFNVGFGFDPADNPESARGESFSCNEDDQIEGSEYAYDDNGNATQCRDYSLDYDYEDRPTSVAGGLEDITSAYRADGLRASKTVDGTVTYYLYDGDKVVCSFDSESYLVASYTYGPTGLVTRGVYGYSYPPRYPPFYFYMFDPLGSPVTAYYICDASTDQYGNAHTVVYDAFGKRWWDKLNPGHIYSHGEDAAILDSVGYAGQWGAYSDQETRVTEDDSALVLTDDDVYYDPVSVRAVARTAPATSTNSYASSGNNPADEASRGWFENTTDFAAGMGDAISLGLTARIRMWIGCDDVVHRDSGWFKGGTVAGIATDVASGGAVLKIGVKGFKNAVQVARAKTVITEGGEAAGAMKALTSGRVANACGKIVSFVTTKTETYYRVYSESPVGGFLTKVKPKSAKYAREGLALPSGNKAEFIQEVIVPKGTRLQRSRCLSANGCRGGLEQFELLDRIPRSCFKPGVPLK